jgi:transcriptional regulator with XRE-family HTH domain
MKKARHTRAYGRVLQSLREVRKEAGLTQADVAAQFGTHASFVSKCESGERRVDVVELAEFCRMYGVSIAAFVKRAGLE